MSAGQLTADTVQMVVPPSSFTLFTRLHAGCAYKQSNLDVWQVDAPSATFVQVTVPKQRLPESVAAAPNSDSNSTVHRNSLICARMGASSLYTQFCQSALGRLGRLRHVLAERSVCPAGEVWSRAC